MIPGYEVLRELARGGMGVVYEAWSPALGQSVALKVVHPDLILDGETLQRLEREVAAQARIRHPNVVRVLDTGRAQGFPWIALELVPGEDLEARIKRTGPVPPRVAAAWTRALAGGLAQAHALGVLHRDLKPANVLLGPDDVPRLTDFGLARLDEDRRRLTATGVILGTPAYMAPEQTAGDSKKLDVRTDVYGLGAVLYEMLSGVPPFRGRSQLEVLEAVVTRDPEPPSAHQPGVDRALEAICLRCLARSPDRRFPTADALGDALAAWERAADRAGRRPGLLPVTLALGLLAAAGVAVAVIAREPAPPPSTPPEPPVSQPPPLADVLARGTTCAALLAAAEAAGPDVDAALRQLSLPEQRGRLLFALHLRESQRDVEAWHSRTASLERLLAEPEARPWSGLARGLAAIARQDGEGIREALRELEALGDDGGAWTECLRASARYFEIDQPGPARLAAARAALRRALELDPGLWLAVHSAGVIELQEDDLDAAQALVERHPCTDSGGAVIVGVLRVMIVDEQGLLDDAWWMLCDLLARPERQVTVLLRGAELQLARGRHARALELADAILAGPCSAPTRIAALGFRGTALRRLHDWEGAAKSFWAAAESSPIRPEIESWAEVQIELRRVEESLPRLRELLGDRPERGLERLIVDMERRAAAERQLRVPDHLGIPELQALGREHARAGRIREVVAVLDRILELDPAHAAALQDRALARFRLKHDGAGVRDLEALGKLRPLDLAELQQLAFACQRTGRERRAIELWDQLLAQEPGRWEYRAARLGDIIELGDVARAEPELASLTAEARTPVQRAGAAWVRCNLMREKRDARGALEALREVPADLLGAPGTGMPPVAELREVEAHLERMAARSR